ncbi:MAG: hypothetical protein CVT80_02925 [Alphaproteobacteria bacterium HGW-Alphaproteobacteria-2]|nr:MAG: hypothetical protein CVT80_02925 [Alphaproteobacteria bacterium HGW-Alphaproteobacteria-2]
MRQFLALVLSTGLVVPAAADDFTDALGTALDAYEAGDIQQARDELGFAMQILNEMSAASFSALLPAPLPGWTREMGDSASGMAAAMFGGGTMAHADYASGSDSFSIMLIADSPMIASMGAMFANPALMQGRPLRIGRERFVEKDGQIMGLIANRVLVQAEGGDRGAMIAHLEAMDFAALAGF